ncbi:hypothetical protein B0E42_11390 [Pseudomonas sp. A25(2017)]|nr:hypothetical protein B0E42_11390 [Pseudomonas sp. A25(2017)]
MSIMQLPPRQEDDGVCGAVEVGAWHVRVISKWIFIGFCLLYYGKTIKGSSGLTGLFVERTQICHLQTSLRNGPDTFSQ